MSSHFFTCEYVGRLKTIRYSVVSDFCSLRFVRSLYELNCSYSWRSHLNSDVLKSFEFLFPYLDENGTYVIEDTQTSYWPKYGGDSYSLSKPSTTMGYFKSLVDGLNYEEIARSGFTASYLDIHINSIHFYHNMIFIQKGLNKEGSKYALKHKY